MRPLNLILHGQAAELTSCIQQGNGGPHQCHMVEKYRFVELSTKEFSSTTSTEGYIKYKIILSAICSHIDLGKDILTLALGLIQYTFTLVNCTLHNLEIFI